ncbi:hypothetical protein KEM56_000871 [Ascosphaera pollenicola]|nr:hypothetical protein KEM56_000871 [Ascosphaera pollenicola]
MAEKTGKPRKKTIAKRSTRKTTDEQVASQIGKELQRSIEHATTVKPWHDYAGSAQHDTQAETPTRRPNARLASLRSRGGAGSGFSMLVEGSKRKPEGSQVTTLQKPAKVRKTYGKSKALQDLYDVPGSSSSDEAEIMSQPAAPEDLPVEDMMYDDLSEEDDMTIEQFLTKNTDSDKHGKLATLPEEVDENDNSDENNALNMASGPDNASDEHAETDTDRNPQQGAFQSVRRSEEAHDESIQDPNHASTQEFHAVVISTPSQEADKPGPIPQLLLTDGNANPTFTSNTNSQSQASDARQLLREAHQSHSDIVMMKDSRSEGSIVPSGEEDLIEQDTGVEKDQRKLNWPSNSAMSAVRHRKRKRRGHVVEETPEAEIYPDKQELATAFSRLPAQEDSDSEGELFVSRQDHVSIVSGHSDEDQPRRRSDHDDQAARSGPERSENDQQVDIFDIYKHRQGFKAVISFFNSSAITSAWEQIILLTRQISLETEARELSLRNECSMSLYKQLARIQHLYDGSMNAGDTTDNTSEEDTISEISLLMDETISQTRTLEFEDESIVSSAEKGRRRREIPTLAVDLSMIIFPAIISVTISCLLSHFDQTSIDSQGLSFAHDLLGFAHDIAERLRPSNFRSAKIQIVDKLRSHRRYLPQLKDACFQETAKARLEEAYRQNLHQGLKTRETRSISPHSISDNESEGDTEPEGHCEWDAQKEDTLLEGLYRFRGYPGMQKYHRILHTYAIIGGKRAQELKAKAKQMSDQWVLLSKQEGTQLDPIKWDWLLNV